MDFIKRIKKNISRKMAKIASKLVKGQRYRHSKPGIIEAELQKWFVLDLLADIGENRAFNRIYASHYLAMEQE